MQLLIDKNDLIKYKSRDPIPLKCECCQKTFHKPKNLVMSVLKLSNNRLRCCSNYCFTRLEIKHAPVYINCNFCGKKTIKTGSDYKKSKNHFCSRSCRAKFHNRNKKLENKVCPFCQKNFHPHDNSTKFCSKKCLTDHQNKNTAYKTISCSNCKKIIKRKSYKIKSKKSFCNKRCRMTYSLMHLIKPTRYNRSQLEIFLEKELKNKSDLVVLFNRRNIIFPYELDLFFPKIKLAIELNGPLHYKPIYGIKKLEYIQTKDKNKHKMCSDKKINLIVFDTSKDGPFNSKTGLIYLDKIKNIIDGTRGVS